MPTITRTEAQKEASRRNGARSKGPKTPAGKAVSARNAEKHGMRGHAVVLHNENLDEYNAIVADYRGESAPKTRREKDLVMDLITARWRLNRLVSCETAAIDKAINEQRPDLDAEYDFLDDASRTDEAIAALARRNSRLDNYQRWGAICNGERSLGTVRRDAKREFVILQNEPKWPSRC